MKSEPFAMQGGLDLVSPALSIKPGMLIDCLNYEPNISGGYRRMYGFERFDGRPAPTAANYWVMEIALTAAVAVGNVIVGATSGATAVIIKVNAPGELILTNAAGTFGTEQITLGVTPIGTASTTTLNGAAFPADHANYKLAAANYYRALIGKVPGSGPVRGSKWYNGANYAFRDNVGATACLMYKSTPSGWVQVQFGREIQFTNAVGQINEGDTVTGASGGTGIVRRALLRSGTWTVGGVGTLIFDTVTGSFASGAALQVGGTTKATAGTADTAIALKPGGRFEFDNNNFAGSSATYRMYGCDGVNIAFEFDGTRFVPIRTGAVPDMPSHVAVWENMLVLAQDSTVQLSSITNPYAWTAFTGAAELALGSPCTGLLPQTGNATTGAMAIFTARRTFVLYGTSTADLNLVIQSPDAGAQPYSAQNIGFAYYLDTKGVVQINSTQAYGNFEQATLTRLVQPIIDAHRGMLSASCIVRASNQYRLFFTDGTGLILYLTQSSSTDGTNSSSAAAIMPFDYASGSGVYMNAVDSIVDESGIERIFGSGSDGYVYELERGTSFDGLNISSHLLLAFNSNRSPRNRKHYKRTILQASCQGTANVQVGYEMSYGGPEADGGLRSNQGLIGTGGYWDQFTFDSFNWDSPYVQEYVIDTPGNGRNIGLLIYGEDAVDLPYTISSAILNYTINRLER